MLTKEQAIQAMHEGKKVAHDYFCSGEWMRYDGLGYVFEDGIWCTEDEFWYWRQEGVWNTGWRILD